MTFDLTDDFGNPQHQLSRLTPEISLPHEAGLAEWAGHDRRAVRGPLFLVDGLSPPVPISDSISVDLHGPRPRGQPARRREGVPQPLLPADAQRGGRPGRAARLPPEPSGQGAAALLPVVGVGGYAGRHRRARRRSRTTPQLPRRPPGRVAGGLSRGPSRRSPRRARSLDPDGVPIVFDVETRDFPTGRRPAQSRPPAAAVLRLARRRRDRDRLLVRQRHAALPGRHRLRPQLRARSSSDYPNYDSLLRGFATDPEQHRVGAVRSRSGTCSNRGRSNRPASIRCCGTSRPPSASATCARAFAWSIRITQIKIRIVQFAVRPTTHAR